MAVRVRFDAHQRHQLEAVAAVLDLFAGQEAHAQQGNRLDLAAEQVRANLAAVQAASAIPDELRRPGAAEYPDRFFVEMETGTGKTYTYLRTALELHRRYGWRKFVVVVPSVAVREGVLSALGDLRSHFRDLFDGLGYEHSVYDSAQLHRVRRFASSADLQIMVVTIAAITGDRNNRLMHRPTDVLHGDAPIDLLRACRPVLLLDEPQSLDGAAQRVALDALNPLVRIGYSATPPRDRSGLPSAQLLYRLTPVDAYRERLVKRIGVRSVTRDVDLDEPFVEVTSVRAGAGSVTAAGMLHRAGRHGVRPARVTLRLGDDLVERSGGRWIYRGWRVSEIDAVGARVHFANGRTIEVGGSTSAASPQQQRLMLTEAVRAHLQTEARLAELYRNGELPARIKPLTLFFIERVEHYAPAGARLREWFTQAYESLRSEPEFAQLDLPDVARVHAGYFAESKGRAKDAPAESADAADAFQRIMRGKAELLGFEEPLRFVFSHSALAEGWDNPNVFTLCNLQDGTSTMRRRQQLGRGLRLPVMENGERCRNDEVNLLTVVAKESFAGYAAGLQTEIAQETGVQFTGRILDLTRERPRIRLRHEVVAGAEFTALWAEVSVRTRCRIRVDSDRLVQYVTTRLEQMAPLADIRLRVSATELRIDASGVGGMQGAESGTEIAAHDRVLPDVVAELSGRLPISRDTIVRILSRCGRLGEIEVNPSQFIDRVAGAVTEALDSPNVTEVEYRPTGQTWPLERFIAGHREESFARRVVPVSKSVTDHVVCASAAEQAMVEEWEADDSVRLLVRLPDWFTVPTPLGDRPARWALLHADTAVLVTGGSNNRALSASIPR